MVMSLPVSASVPDLAMTVPTGFAAALGIWFAATTAMLIAEAGLARRIAKFRAFGTWRAPPSPGFGLLYVWSSSPRLPHREAPSAPLTGTQPADCRSPELSCELPPLRLGWA